MQKAALSPKRKGGRHTPKRHSYQSIFKSTPTTSSEGDDVAAGGDGGAGDGVSAGGAGADAGAGNQAQSGDFEHDEEELQQEGGEKAAGRELDPEMRSALNQFVSAVGSISTSFKNSFSFKRPSNRTVPINDSDDDNDKNELDKVMAQSRAIKAASGAHSSGAQTPKLTPKYSARKGVAGDYMEALAMANCALDATPRDNTSVGRLTPAVSIADSSHISQQSSCQVTPTGTGAAASTAGVFPKAVPRKRASYLGSFLSFGGFGASEKNSPSLTPGAGPAGGESRKHPSGSVMGAVSHMFNGLFSSASASGSSSGRKHSNSDLNNGGSRVGKKADFQVPLRTEPLLQ